MDRKHNNILATILKIIKELVYALPEKHDFFIELEIMSTDGVINKIIMNHENINDIKVKRNIITNNDIVISTEEIIKLKIMNTNLDNDIKNMFMVEMSNLINNESQKNYIQNVNSRGSNRNTSKHNNMESYIEENIKNIKSICCDGIISDYNINCIKNISREDVLNNNTFIDVKRIEMLKNIDFEFEESKVVSSIDENKKKVIKDISMTEKLVLTNNSEDVEVAKPINTEDINVVTELHIANEKVVTNQSSSTVVKDLKENKSEAIVDLKSTYEENLIGNINKKNQIIQPQKMDLLIVEPVNTNINKEEVKNRYLTLDPTGENFIGVILEDGTFEPLKVSMETFTVIPNSVENILINIDEENIVDKVVKDIDCFKGEFINTLNIEYKDNVLEYKEENEKSIKDIISTSNKSIKNITNKDETVRVVTKSKVESMNNIEDIQYDLVSKIDEVNKIPVVKDINFIKTNETVLDDVLLNKQSTNIVSNIDTVNEKISLPIKEDIKGKIDLVGNGVMIVSDDEGILIYSTSKITAINI